MRSRRLAYAVAAAAILVSALPLAGPVSSAFAYTSGDVTAHQEKAAAARAAAARADKAASALLTESRRLAAIADTTSERLGRLGGKLGDLQTHRIELQTQLDRLRFEIAGREAAIAATASLLRTQRAAFGERARAHYMSDPLGVFELLLTSRDLGDLLSRTTYLQDVMASDEAAMDGLRTTARQLESARLQLSTAQRQVAMQRDAISAQEQAIAGVRREAVATLDEQRAAQRAREGLLAETKANAKRLREIADAEEAEGAAIAAELRGTGSHGSGATPGGLSWPCPASHDITSGFGWRYHPILKTRRFHQGIDIGAPSGSRIVAAAAGTVIFAGDRGGYGNTVMIDHGDGLVTVYAHQSRIAVSEGQRVRRSQTIGRVGSTGLSTGPHVHFETRVNGHARDPLGYL